MSGLWIPGTPQPKERPRTVILKNGKRRTYTPKKTLTYERAVASAWQEHTLGADPLQGPVVVTIRFNPKGIQVDVQPLDRDPVIETKGDIDNLTKSVLDGLNGVAYLDDKQVVESHLFKD